MNRKKIYIEALLLICFGFIFSAPALSSEWPPIGDDMVIKGKAMNGYMTLLNVSDGVQMVIIGTCDKGVPFQIGPFIDNLSLDDFTPEVFDLTYIPEAVPFCYTGDQYYHGLVITGIKNWIRTPDDPYDEFNNGGVACEVTLQPLVKDAKLSPTP